MDRALLAFWVSNGVRAEELLTCRQRDALPGEQLLGVVRKGTRAYQQVPSAADAFVWLRLYQEEAWRAGVPRGPGRWLWWTLRPPFRPLTYHAARASFDANAQVRMDTWAKGRVVLLGDAGYCAGPTSGRGTSQALIGAYILAGELAAAGGDHTTAFAAYERGMRGYVTEHQALGREGAERFFMPAPTQEVLDMLAAQAPENTRATPVRLRDYTTASPSPEPAGTAVAVGTV